MLTIEEKRDVILTQLKGLNDTDKRYEFLISKGRSMEPLPEETRLDKFLVKGCISRAWLVPSYREGRIHFRADSEAAIVKGILAVLLDVYDDSTPEAILQLSPEFLKEGGVTDHLSMNRRNGLAHFCKQIQLYAATYKALAQKGIDPNTLNP